MKQKLDLSDTLNICKYIIGVLLVIHTLILMIIHNYNLITLIPVSTLAYGTSIAATVYGFIVGIQTLKVAFHAIRYESKSGDIDPELIILTNILCMASAGFTLFSCAPMFGA